MFTFSVMLTLILLFAQSTQTLPTTNEATGLASTLTRASEIPASTKGTNLQELPSAVTTVETLTTEESSEIVTDQAKDSKVVKTEISPTGQGSNIVATGESIKEDHSSAATADSLEPGTEQVEVSTESEVEEGSEEQFSKIGTTEELIQEDHSSAATDESPNIGTDQVVGLKQVASEINVSDPRSNKEERSGASETAPERKAVTAAQPSEAKIEKQSSETTLSVEAIATDEKFTEEVKTEESLLSSGTLLTEESESTTAKINMESTVTGEHLTGSSFDVTVPNGQPTESTQSTSSEEKTTITGKADVNGKENKSESIIVGSAVNLNPTISMQPSNTEGKTTVTTTGENISASSEQESSHEGQTVTAVPTEGSFTFILPDFHAQESSNSSMALDHHFNDTEWEIMGAAASSEDADEMFDDPCAYLSHRVEHLLSLNISKQAVQKIITDLKLGNFEEEKLPALKKILEVCLEEHEKADGEVDEDRLSPACRDLHQTVTSVCMATEGCKLEEAVKVTMTHIEHLLTTESLHDALVMMRACADQVYHEQVEEQN